MQTDVVDINGVNIFIFEGIGELLGFIDGKKCGILIAVNAGKIHKATDVTRNIINDNIGYIDGVGALYAARKKGYKEGIIIPGCDLWLEIIKRHFHAKSFYFIGAKQEIIVETINRLKQEFPGIDIKNYRNGYFDTEDEIRLLTEDIIARKPDIIFVGMGSPRQELFMKKLAEQYPALYQGVGGSFDIYAGVLKRAPEWLIELNLGGIYRVLTDISLNRIKRLFSDISFMAKVFFGFYK